MRKGVLTFDIKKKKKTLGEVEKDRTASLQYGGGGGSSKKRGGNGNQYNTTLMKGRGREKGVHRFRSVGGGKDGNERLISENSG